VQYNWHISSIGDSHIGNMPLIFSDISLCFNHYLKLWIFMQAAILI